MDTYQLSPELAAWGASIQRALVRPGEPYWQIIEAQGPVDIGGLHHLMVDVWDEQGNRVIGQPVIFFSPEEEWLRVTERKQGEPYAVNMPMYAGGNAYGVKIGGGAPTDVFFGAGLGSYVDHHSFRVIFRRSIADALPVPATPPVEPRIRVDADPPLTALEELEAAKFYLDRAIALLERA